MKHRYLREASWLSLWLLFCAVNALVAIKLLTYETPKLKNHSVKTCALHAHDKE